MMMMMMMMLILQFRRSHQRGMITSDIQGHRASVTPKSAMWVRESPYQARLKE